MKSTASEISAVCEWRVRALRAIGPRALLTLTAFDPRRSLPVSAKPTCVAAESEVDASRRSVSPPPVLVSMMLNGCAERLTSAMPLPWPSHLAPFTVRDVRTV